MPLGGWAGTVARVDRGTFLVQWSRETLENIHPICRKRCAIDGTELAAYWLPEHELEADAGGPLAIEQPGQITPRPLSAKNQGDRVRMVFGLTSDDFLPEADEDSLETYYDHLASRLSLPMEAKYDARTDFFRSSRCSVKVVKVVALDREIGWEDGDGIYCKIRNGKTEEVVPLADLEIRRSNPNYRLISDYSEWFFGGLCEDFDDEELDDDEEEEEEDVLPEAVNVSLAGGVLHLVAIFTAVGAVLGPAIATMSWAKWAAGIGAAVLGLIMATDAAKGAKQQPLRIMRFVETTVGLTFGLVYGAVLGTTAVAFIGAGLGFIAWLLLRRLRLKVKLPVILALPPGGVIAAACGVVAEAFYLNRQAAASGLYYGAPIGLGCGALFCLVLLTLVYLASKTLPKPEYWRVKS